MAANEEITVTDGASGKVSRALLSAEVLLSSLLDHASGEKVRAKDGVDGAKLASCDTETAASRSLTATNSLVGLGERSLLPSQLSAILSANQPTELVSPRETLQSFALSTSGYVDHDTTELRLAECERNLTVAAQMGLALLSRNEMMEHDIAQLSETVSTAESRVAQLRHDLAVKDSLLEQYIQDAVEAENGEPSLPSWVQTLTEENSELKMANNQLRADNVQLQHNVEQMVDRSLVQQCLEQFSAAKEELYKIQHDMEEREKDIMDLRNEKRQLTAMKDEILSTHHILKEDNDELREQLATAQRTINQLLVEVQGVHDHNEELSAAVEDAQEEIRVLKELTSVNSSGDDEPQFTLSGVGEHTESIVKEIEDALRKEIIAASTLPERPPSPNHYARQRTMVVMETVRAATLASARRMEQIARSEATHGPNDSLCSAPRTSSRASSDGGSHSLVPDELGRYRQQKNYLSPQRLQIVKPMEGSVTLLRWKLLATPELGGAASYFTSTPHPGVHLKHYSATACTPGLSANRSNTAHRMSRSVSDLTCIKSDNSSHKHRVTDSTASGKSVKYRSYSPQPPKRSAHRPLPPSQSPSVLQRLWNALSPNKPQERTRSNFVDDDVKPNSTDTTEQFLPEH